MPKAAGDIDEPAMEPAAPATPRLVR
jgi:hypothetical protein